MRLFVSAILLLFVAFLADLVSDRLPVDRFLWESGNAGSRIYTDLLVASGVVVVLAGFVSSKAIQGRKGQVFYWIVVVAFLLFGYGLFATGAPLGVRRFILGTETWRVSTHLEHFIRYCCLCFMPVQCIAIGLVMVEQTKRPLWSWIWLIGLIAASIFLWYLVYIHKAKTVLYLELLLERNRLLSISFFFFELVLMGCAVGLVGKRRNFDSIGLAFVTRVFYLLCVMMMLTAMAFTIDNGLRKEPLHGQQSSWLSGLSPAGSVFDDELINSLLGLFSILLLFFLGLCCVHEMFTTFVGFLETRLASSTARLSSPSNQGGD